MQPNRFVCQRLLSELDSGRAISLETLRKLGAALDIVFLVGSTGAVAVAAAVPRTVVVPEAPIEPKPVQLRAATGR